MTKPEVVLRPMVPEDGEALVQLALSSPDTGQIQISAVYHVDPYQMAMAQQGETVGVVATLPVSGQVVGSGFVSCSRRTYEGELRDVAWLHNLLVHPDYRRQGIAKKLASWRIACARERLGNDVIIGAAIQKGNIGSFSVANSWSAGSAGEVRGGVIAMRARPPKKLDDMQIRRVNDDDLDPVAAGLNSFYKEYNFHARQTADELRRWLEYTPVNRPIRTYLVAENAAGELVAGMAVVEDHRMAEMQVQHLSLPLRLINKVVRLVPPDGRMKQLAVMKSWFGQGHLNTLQFIWETIRWEWRDKGNTVTFSYDPRSPLKEIFKTPPWIPQTSLTYAVSELTPESPRLICAG
jgi:GNAT superfamily N-acetyltransferase